MYQCLSIQFLVKILYRALMIYLQKLNTDKFFPSAGNSSFDSSIPFSVVLNLFTTYKYFPPFIYFSVELLISFSLPTIYLTLGMDKLLLCTSNSLFVFYFYFSVVLCLSSTSNSLSIFSSSSILALLPIGTGKLFFSTDNSLSNSSIPLSNTVYFIYHW